MAPQVSKGMPARNQRVVARCLGPVSQRTVTQACGQDLKLHALIHACLPPLPPHCVIPATTGSGLAGSDQSYEGCTSRTSVVRVVATRRSNLENLEDGFCSASRSSPFLETIQTTRYCSRFIVQLGNDGKVILCLNIEIEKHEFLRVVVIVRWKILCWKGSFPFYKGG